MEYDSFKSVLIDVTKWEIGIWHTQSGVNWADYNCTLLSLYNILKLRKKWWILVEC